MVYKRLIINISNFFKQFRTNDNYTEKELNQINGAISKWTKSRKSSVIPKYKKGEVYRIEFGLAYEPELAYEHRGLIIGRQRNLYYVLPIATYNPRKHIHVYHPNDFPNGAKEYYLLKQSEYTKLLDHDSVVKCYDLKTVSYKRFIRKVGYIALPHVYQIARYAYKNIFPEIDYNINQQINKLQKEIENITEEKKEKVVI